MDTTQGGKKMKRLIAGILAVAVLAAVVLTVPQPAEARGNFWGGFAAGAVTGVVVGGVLAPRPVYVGPPVVCRLAWAISRPQTSQDHGS